MNKQCICDNYQSYRSTLKPGVSYAMLMQPDECVNCYPSRQDLFSIFVHNKDIMITELDVHRYVKAISPRAFSFNGEPEVDMSQAYLDRLLPLVHSGEAQKYIDCLNEEFEKSNC